MSFEKGDKVTVHTGKHKGLKTTVNSVKSDYVYLETTVSNSKRRSIFIKIHRSNIKKDDVSTKA
jgi:ribosomal protein L24